MVLDRPIVRKSDPGIIMSREIVRPEASPCYFSGRGQSLAMKCGGITRSHSPQPIEFLRIILKKAGADSRQSNVEAALKSRFCLMKKVVGSSQIASMIISLVCTLKVSGVSLESRSMEEVGESNSLACCDNPLSQKLEFNMQWRFPHRGIEVASQLLRKQWVVGKLVKATRNYYFTAIVKDKGISGISLSFLR